MARRSKIETEKQANGQRSDLTSRGVDAVSASKSKGKKAASMKKTVRANKPVARRKPTSPVSTYEPSEEEIRIRAYFIAERRIQLSLQGDSDHDWVEARRQLVEEASRSASSAS